MEMDMEITQQEIMQRLDSERRYAQQQIIQLQQQLTQKSQMSQSQLANLQEELQNMQASIEESEKAKAELQEKLQEILDDMPGQNQGGLSKASEDMLDIVKDLKNNRITNETIDKQNQILSRLLDSQKSLKEKECNIIAKNSSRVLTDAICKGGSSIRDFKNISGTKGTFQKNFKVYQREGLNCKRLNCKGIIVKKNIQKLIVSYDVFLKYKTKVFIGTFRFGKKYNNKILIFFFTIRFQKFVQ